MSADDFFADEYKMDYPQRGKAVIINNRTFDRALGLGERTGTDQDAAALNMRFLEMGFDVDIYHNLVVQDMLGVLGKGNVYIFIISQAHSEDVHICVFV